MVLWLRVFKIGEVGKVIRLNCKKGEEIGF